MKTVDIALGLLRIPLDILAATAALLLSYHLRTQNIDLLPNVQLLATSNTLPELGYYLRTFVLNGVVLFLAITGIARLYMLQIHFTLLREVQRLAIVCVLWAVCVMGWYFLVEKELFYSRILLIHSTIFLLLFVTASRICIRLIKRSLLRHNIGSIHIVSVGSIPLSGGGFAMVQREPRYTYNGHLTTLQELTQATYPIDQVIQTDPSPDSAETLAIIDYCRSEHIDYAFLPPVFADVPHQLRIERVRSVLLIKFLPTALDGWGKVIKRAFDIVISILLIIVLIPVFAVTALVILLTDGLPIFYTSKRVGQYGKTHIPVLKFRSMVKQAEQQKAGLLQKNERDGPLFKIKNDPRVTRFGRLIRRFDIDELPQLFNVLMGHMSLVGPRPHLPTEVARYKAYERRVFAVKPGITGLAQISGRSDLRFEEEVQLDLQYIEEWSLRRDIKILLYTVGVVLRKGGE
jgi:exopolysaccharide biosynthesis polyprenyl glycosylphosphotransferase